MWNEHPYLAKQSAWRERPSSGLLNGGTSHGSEFQNLVSTDDGLHVPFRGCRRANGVGFRLKTVDGHVDEREAPTRRSCGVQ